MSTRLRERAPANPDPYMYFNLPSYTCQLPSDEHVYALFFSLHKFYISRAVRPHMSSQDLQSSRPLSGSLSQGTCKRYMYKVHVELPPTVPFSFLAQVLPCHAKHTHVPYLHVPNVPIHLRLLIRFNRCAPENSLTYIHAYLRYLP